MSKKKINIALIIIVLALWGTVGYKSFNRFLFSPEPLVFEDNYNQTINFNKINKDTFSLEKIKRDPFLNTELEKKKEFITPKYVERPIIVNKPKVVKPIAIIHWPSIAYYGYIKSKDKTEELILVKINNQLYKLRKNSDINGLVINKVYKDSIEVSFNATKKFFYKG